MPIFSAVCVAGLEAVLARELEHLGLQVEERENGRVSFVSDFQGAARALVGLRTAERVMVRLGRFAAVDFDQLYSGMHDLPWEEFCAAEDRVLLAKVRIRGSKLAARTSVQSVAHKAVYTRLSERHRLARLPESGKVREIRLYLENDVCTAGLDLSGENLSRRGYRLKSGEAPLRETIAAALVLLSAWRRKHPFLDLFCGSGTIPIEAAMFALDQAPGLERSFSLESMSCCPPGLFARAREEARDRIRRDLRVRITGLDHDPSLIAVAAENARRAGVAAFITFKCEKMESARPREEDPGFIISNPPYGLRLQNKDEALLIWRALSETRGRFPGWTFGFVVNDDEFPRHFGARPDRSWKLAGGAESLIYYLYRGITAGRLNQDGVSRGGKKLKSRSDCSGR